MLRCPPTTRRTLNSRALWLHHRLRHGAVQRGDGGRSVDTVGVVVLRVGHGVVPPEAVLLLLLLLHRHHQVGVTAQGARSARCLLPLLHRVVVSLEDMEHIEVDMEVTEDIEVGMSDLDDL